MNEMDSDRQGDTNESQFMKFSSRFFFFFFLFF